MIADPRTAVTETDWDNLMKATDNPAGCKFLLSARVAIRLRVLRTVSENPPNVSKAKGMNWIPTSLQFWTYCSYFLSSAADRAKPLFSDAFIMRLDCKGEVTVTSKAAGRPLFHTGKKISPGLEVLSGSKLFCSEMGDKRAPEQADIILSRIRSWGEIISPRPWHDTAWSPITWSTDLQKGHFLSFSYNFTPSRYLRATRNSLEDRCSPRAGMGAADNQAPDCGREGDCKRAFFLMELCFPNKLSKAEFSSSSWIFLWEGYVVAISLNSSTALTNEMSSVGLWPVNFSTRTEDWKTDPTYADLLNLICWSSYSYTGFIDWRACYVPRSVCQQNSKNTFKSCTRNRIKFSKDFIWFVRRRISSQRVDHFGSTKAKLQNTKSTLRIFYIC